MISELICGYIGYRIGKSNKRKTSDKTFESCMDALYKIRAIEAASGIGDFKR